MVDVEHRETPQGVAISRGRHMNQPVIKICTKSWQDKNCVWLLTVLYSQNLIHKWNFVLCLKIQNRPPKEVDGWRKGILDKGDSKYKFLGV